MDHTTQSVLFPDLISKPVLAAFDQAHSSSDGGGLLLKAVDERLGLSAKLADCLRDDRDASRVQHGIEEILRQRLFAIALGHPDCNDAYVLADDPTHGQQEFSFYHGHYGGHCFLPLIGTIQFNRERQQSLLCAVLRPGNAGAALGLVPILERLLEKIRAAFPRARIRVRLDGGFGIPQVLDFLDASGVEYVVGLANWPDLKKRARKAQRLAMREYERTGRTHQIFGETLFKTKRTWPYRRRVIYKAEVVGYPGREPRQNLRLVVTNFTMTPKRVYREYCKRGDPENRIKELKHGLGLGRTSCSSFLANQLRVQITAAAYVLMQELARQARHTALQGAQVTRLRDRLLRLPVWVEESVRRVVLHLPTSFLGQRDWLRIALRLGAVPP